MLDIETFKDVIPLMFAVGTLPFVGAESCPKLIRANSKLTSGMLVFCPMEHRATNRKDKSTVCFINNVWMKIYERCKYSFFIIDLITGSYTCLFLYGLTCPITNLYRIFVTNKLILKESSFSTVRIISSRRIANFFFL